VVDANLQSRGLLASFLAEEGYRTTELAEPEAAPEVLREGDYQLVLLDLGSAPGEGLGVLRRIRRLDDDLCVICLAPEPSVETAVASMKYRAFDYLPKSQAPQELRPVLQAAIREHGLRVDAEQGLNATLGGRIRARRHELRLTLKQVANRTGLSVSLLSQIELGKSAASVFTLYKVSAALGVPMAAFFEAIGPPS